MHGELARRAESYLLGNRLRRSRMIAGHHEEPNARSLRLADHFVDVCARRVVHGGHSEEAPAGVGEVGLLRVPVELGVGKVVELEHCECETALAFLTEAKVGFLKKGKIKFV